MVEECILEGWSKKGKALVDLYKYPCCGELSETIYYGSDNLVECYNNCKISSHKDTFTIESIMKPSCTCKRCGTEISLTPDNMMIGSFNGYMCYKCKNIVAIRFKGYIIQPQTVLKLSWNESISEKISKNLSFIRVTTDKDFLVLRTLNLIARHEYDCFCSIQEYDKKAIIFIDNIHNKYIGYVLWTDDIYENDDHENGNMAAIRQLFIVKEEQKKGHGTFIMKWWVEKIADKINDRFVVESPNKLSHKILHNLGYTQSTMEGIIGIKCSFTH